MRAWVEAKGALGLPISLCMLKGSIGLIVTFKVGYVSSLWHAGALLVALS